MVNQHTRPDNDDPKNESGRLSRSGTSAGISVANDSTSGGSDPIPPEGDKSKSDERPHGKSGH